MSVQTMCTRPVTIVNKTHGGFDAYGAENSTSVTNAITSGYLEETEATEVLVGQETYTSNWRIILLPGVVVGPFDQIIAEGVTYEVIGQPHRPWRPATGEHHVECRLRLTTG